MVHAGVLPSWTVAQTLALAGEVEAVLRGPQPGAFLQADVRQRADRWDDTLAQGAPAARDRQCAHAAALLHADGAMDLKTSGGLAAPPGYMPWFDVPGRRTADHRGIRPLVHAGLLLRPDVLSLDTGCVWGGCLSAVRLGAGPASAN
jgi:bis(5'-nucleosyl)-tetraphosphatase (symmetrical)